MTGSMILMALLGFLIGILFKLARMRKRFRNEFRISVWWNENMFQTAGSVLSIVAMLHFAPMIAPMVVGVPELPEGSMLLDWFSLGAGHFSHTMFHDLMKTFKVENQSNPEEDETEIN